ncbi:hypothetical protein [Pseudomonas sp. RL_5y_Pfl2_73]|uniref:hypothetical protein n=1 Tax=Pseudomonas sp. RL_5y_Pfl2_73 TaxID=3088713 RepID=UPI0030D99FF0
MRELNCSLCRHRSAILRLSHESGAVCRVCLGIGEEAPKRTLRALGFLFRMTCDTWPAGWLKSKSEALINHDRALRGDV